MKKMAKCVNSRYLFTPLYLPDGTAKAHNLNPLPKLVLIFRPCIGEKLDLKLREPDRNQTYVPPDLEA
jgi:hypothetical protein